MSQTWADCPNTVPFWQNLSTEHLTVSEEIVLEVVESDEMNLMLFSHVTMKPWKMWLVQKTTCLDGTVLPGILEDVGEKYFYKFSDKKLHTSYIRYMCSLRRNWD